ncbi:hypothetical protein M1523_04580 [Patescibacteria group bacterium]|nr:hypothetical protein [Patescibacteria group bacterium]MCL5091501.1 hypothetical protein [Patescibacteria group bacterium]
MADQRIEAGIGHLKHAAAPTALLSLAGLVACSGPTVADIHPGSTLENAPTAPPLPGAVPTVDRITTDQNPEIPQELRDYVTKNGGRVGVPFPLKSNPEYGNLPDTTILSYFDKQGQYRLAFEQDETITSTPAFPLWVKDGNSVRGVTIERSLDSNNPNPAVTWLFKQGVSEVEMTNMFKSTDQTTAESAIRDMLDQIVIIDNQGRFQKIPFVQLTPGEQQTMVHKIMGNMQEVPPTPSAPRASATPTPTTTPTTEATATVAPTATREPTATATKEPAWYDSTDIEVRRKGVEEWANRIDYTGYTPQEVAELKQLMIDYLPYVHSSPLKVFPWYNNFPYEFSENPLAYLQAVRGITNNDNKGTSSSLTDLYVKLDRNFFKTLSNNDSKELSWLMQISKEAMVHYVYTSSRSAARELETKNVSAQIVKQTAKFLDNNWNRHDLGTVSAAIVTLQDLVDAKKPDGSWLITDPATRSDLSSQAQSYISGMNQVATQNGWIATTPWQ